MSPGVRRARERAIEVRGARIPGSGGWRPYVLTVAALTLVWMALWGSASPIIILLGIAVAALVLLLFPLPFLEFRFGLHPWRMLVLVLRFLWDVVVASLQVGWLALRPRPPRPEVIQVQLTTDSDLLQSLTALAVSLVPGSLIIDLDPDARTLLIHVLDGEQQPPTTFPDEVRAQERRIQLALGDESVNSSVTPQLHGRQDRRRRRTGEGGRR
jgi:multicomponent Na+:H+ antiporter subunit E